MDLVYLKKLLRIFEESNASKLEIDEEGIKLKLAKASANPYIISDAQFQNQNFTHQQPNIHFQVQSNEAGSHQQKNSSEISDAEALSDLHIVHSPIVGTYYSAPSPESLPFTEVGSRVTKGQTLCIIEAMKLMNEIESDETGIIEKILVQNGKPVEFNQPLFVIRPE